MAFWYSRSAKKRSPASRSFRARASAGWAEAMGAVRGEESETRERERERRMERVLRLGLACARPRSG